MLRLKTVHVSGIGILTVIKTSMIVNIFLLFDIGFTYNQI